MFLHQGVLSGKVTATKNKVVSASSLQYFLNPLKKFFSAAEIDKVFLNIPVGVHYGFILLHKYHKNLIRSTHWFVASSKGPGESSQEPDGGRAGLHLELELFKPLPDLYHLQGEVNTQSPILFLEEGKWKSGSSLPDPGTGRELRDKNSLKKFDY